MTTIFLVFLFITQMISFYFLALFYMKLSKFDDLEKKQNRLMKEMDDAIAVYLAEIKDENDKLVEKITAKTKGEKRTADASLKLSEKNLETRKEGNPPPVTITMPKNTIRHHARQSYEAVKQNVLQEDIEIDDRTRAIQLYEDGKSVAEIAKVLEKGQTEIELILKFK
ncbi:DUF6115 domain-containing protein [Sporosarcina ureilytica]|uniref:Swarming motility protein SwrB n=1 Tax=Sporosarcina ureilytica TaxID=298596 RepID=A0A1D8JHS7_9BACL|nr:hypothetical protein [Sporosarcina ureilytica]AOV08246.1 hypothetical protein BI350_12355 [Sporosarcina ureilytica]